MNYIHNMIENLDLQQLRMFFALVQVGSYTEAAKRVYRTQSAVSHAIRKLERSIGATLIDQKGRSFSLTEEGRRLYEACETAFYALESASEAISQSSGRSLGRIRMGGTVEFGCSVLMKHMTRFAKTHPDIDLEMTLATELLDPLLRDELDLIVDCQEHNRPELRQDVLFRESYAAVCAPSYQQEMGLNVPMDLSACTVLSPDRNGVWWNRFLMSVSPMKRPSLTRTVIISHIRACIVAATRGLGVALVPRYSVLAELESGELVSLFPKLRILEDRFCIYQKRAKEGLERNRLLTEFLKAMTPAEFG